MVVASAAVAMEWSPREDLQQAGGFRGEHFGGNHIREALLVIGLPKDVAIFARPMVLVRRYEDGRVTLAEGEWRD